MLYWWLLLTWQWIKCLALTLPPLSYLNLVVDLDNHDWMSCQVKLSKMNNSWMWNLACRNMQSFIPRWWYVVDYDQWLSQIRVMCKAVSYKAADARWKLRSRQFWNLRSFFILRRKEKSIGISNHKKAKNREGDSDTGSVFLFCWYWI